jgi:hypothetical protein
MISSCAKLAHNGSGSKFGDTYILADGDAAHSVLLAELLTQRRLKTLEQAMQDVLRSSYAHDDPTHTTRRTEVRLSRFAARARDL